jgi:hypothetical protein
MKSALFHHVILTTLNSLSSRIYDLDMYHDRFYRTRRLDLVSQNGSKNGLLTFLRRCNNRP